MTISDPGKSCAQGTNSPAARPKLGGGSLSFEKTVLPWLFLLPLVALNLLVMLGPSIGSLYYAFTDWKGMGRANWVGLANFTAMLKDSMLTRAFRNNLRWMVLSMTIPPLLALVTATLLAEVKRGQRVFRTIYFLPLVISSAVAAQAWLGIYHPNFGLLGWLKTNQLVPATFRLLGSPKLALYLVFVASTWKGWGFPMVMFLAAMQQVPTELYEAAIIDGASRVQQFRFITIPSIRPTLVLMLIFTLIGSMLVFDYIYVMTRGGPGSSTDVIAYRMYVYAFTRYQAGYGAAIGVTLSIWAAIVTLGFLFLRRRGWEV
jgi:raffinose/stachyose/melibiose transport system permease protein